MNNSLNSLKIFLSIAIVSLLTITNSTASEQLEEIIVTGKILQSNSVNSLQPALNISDVPQSISITTFEDIRSRGFRDLGDIVRYTPGLNTSQGEGHRDSIVFRGVRSTADFYRDGLRDDVQYFRSLYNVDQVEILRGPNALLFGRGGTGGVINRVTKKAVIGEEFGSVDIGSDSYGAFDFTADYNIETSINSAFRVNIHRDSLANHRDFFNGDRVGFNPTLKFKISDKTTLNLSYEYANHERFIDRGIPTQNGQPARALAGVVFGDQNINVQRLEANILRGTLRYKFSENTIGNLSLQYDEFDKMYRNLYASGYDGDLVTMDGYKDPTARQNIFVDANLVFDFHVGPISQTISLATQIIDTSNANLRYNTYWSTTKDDNEIFDVLGQMNFRVNSDGIPTSVDFTSDLNNSTTSDVEVTSVYIQDRIDLSDRLIIMLGGRFDNFNITVNDLKGDTTQSREDNEVSPRAGIVFKPQENLSLYASYSESFLPRSGEQYKKLSASSARLDPDVFQNTEFGVKWDILSNLSFTAAYFDSDQQQAVRDSVTGEQAEIVGLQVDGYEFEVKGHVTDNLYLAAGYSRMVGKTGKAGEPRELPRSAAYLWAVYQVNNKLGIATGFTYQDQSNIKNDKPGLIIPSYTRWDAAAYYNLSQDFEIRVNIENLSDELYFPHSHSTHQVSVGEGLNARLSVTRRL